MADENRDQPHQSIEDRNDEVVGIHEHAQHLMEEYYSDEVDEDYSDEVDEEYSEEEELDYEYDEDEFEDEDEDEEEEEEEEEEEDEEDGLINQDSENTVETASFCGGEENAGGGGLNRGEIDGLFCPICMEAWTNGGDHQVCCLPCGHIYGLSCIKTWIQRNRSSRKCPQCNQKCALKDVRVLYASRIVVADEELQKKVQTLEAKCAYLKKKNAKCQKEELKRMREDSEALRESTRNNRALMEQLKAHLAEREAQKATIENIFQRQAMFEKRIESMVASGQLPPTFLVPW